MTTKIDDILAERGSREGSFDRASVEKESRTVELSFSSEAPVERWFGMEILSHAPGAMNMERLSSGRANLLVNHNPNDWVGVIESARIDSADKMGRSKVRFSKSARANEVFQDVEDDILKSVSFMYSRDEMKLTKQGKDSPDEYTVTRWTPFEVSLVTIPADMNVGVGRAAESPEAEVATKQPATADLGVRTMEKIETTGAPAEKQMSAVEAEQERKLAIGNLCKTFKIDSRIEASWIEQGMSLNFVASEIVKVGEERAKTKPVEASTLGLTSKETVKYSLFRAIRAMRYGGQTPQFLQEAAFEIECSRAVARQLGRPLTQNILIPGEVLQRPLGEAAVRAMATTPGSKGGYMVNVTNMGFIDILRNRSVAMNMGARILGGLQGNVTFARQTGKPTVTWQGGEGTSIAAADQALGQLSMTPKTCIAITDVSEQLLAQASPSAESFIMADLARDVAIDGVDNAVINGTGGAQPLGIKNTSGVATGQDAATFSYAKALAFPVVAGTANAIRGNPGWVTNIAGASIGMQRQRFTSTDSPIWVGNLMDGELVGFRAMASEQLAAANIIFGSWDEVVIGEWGVLELSTDNGGTRFNQAQVGIRAMWMVDVLLRYPQSFVVGTNLS